MKSTHTITYDEPLRWAELQRETIRDFTHGAPPETLPASFITDLV